MVRKIDEISSYCDNHIIILMNRDFKNWSFFSWIVFNIILQHITIPSWVNESIIFVISKCYADFQWLISNVRLASFKKLFHNYSQERWWQKFDCVIFVILKNLILRAANDFCVFSIIKVFPSGESISRR